MIRASSRSAAGASTIDGTVVVVRAVTVPWPEYATAPAVSAALTDGGEQGAGDGGDDDCGSATRQVPVKIHSQ